MQPQDSSSESSRGTAICLSVAFSPNGELVASGSSDYTVRIWDVKTGQLQRELKGHSSTVSSLSFSPNSARVASGSWDNTIRVWDAATGQLQLEIKGDCVDGVWCIMRRCLVGCIFFERRAPGERRRVEASTARSGSGMHPRESSSESSRDTAIVSHRSRFPQTACTWRAGATTTRSGSGMHKVDSIPLLAIKVGNCTNFRAALRVLSLAISYKLLVLTTT